MFIASDARFICAYNIYANVEQKELHNFKKNGSAFFTQTKEWKKNWKKEFPKRKLQLFRLWNENGGEGEEGRNAIPLET